MPAEIPCAIDQEACRLDGGFEAFEGCNEGLQVAGGSRREITGLQRSFPIVLTAEQCDDCRRKRHACCVDLSPCKTASG